MGTAATLTPRQRAYVSRIASGLSAGQAAAHEFVHAQAVHQAIMRGKERSGAETLAHLIALSIVRGEVIYAGDGEFRPAEVAR